MHFLTPDQVTGLAEAITPRFRILIYAAAYTGMRAGELAALRLPRLNLLAGTFDVTESMMEVGGQQVTGPAETGRPGTLTLPGFLAECSANTSAAIRHRRGRFTVVEGGPIRQRNFSAATSRRPSSTRPPPDSTSTASATPAPPS